MIFPWTEIRLLRKALSLYAGNHVAERVTQLGDGAFSLSSTRGNFVLMFIDIAGFNEPWEPLTPGDLQAMLNMWFEALSACISNHGGTLDTYVGDSMSAWWSIDGNTGDADPAVKCGRAIVQAVARLNDDYKERAWPHLRVSVGIHAGPARLGNYGSTQRIRYSVQGDAVNFASRLCGRANQYGRPVLISETARELLKHKTDLDYIETIRIKGVDDSIQIYALGPPHT